MRKPSPAVCICILITLLYVAIGNLFGALLGVIIGWAIDTFIDEEP